MGVGAGVDHLFAEGTRFAAAVHEPGAVGSPILEAVFDDLEARGEEDGEGSQNAGSAAVEAALVFLKRRGRMSVKKSDQ